MAALVAGVRLLLVARWAGDAPYMDECNATGWLQILAGTGGLTFKYLISPFFEHRVLTERLYSLGLAWANGGQWDVRVEMVAGACLWGLFAGALSAFGGCSLRGWSMVAWAILVFFAEAIPHGWQNLLWAFQIGFLFLAAFSVLAFWLVPRSKAFSFPWWCGVACGVAACVSLGAGILVWPVLIAVSAARLALTGSGSAWRSWGALGVLAVALGLALWANAYTEPPTWLHAVSIEVWGKACLALLAWPWSGFPWAALVIWLPCLVFLAFSRRLRPLHAESWGMALLLWPLAQILSASWARGTELAVDFPHSRYADVLVLGVLANGWLILGWVRARGAKPARWRRQGIALLWIAGMVAGMFCYTREWSSSPRQLGGEISLPDFIAARRMQADAYRKYVQTGDEKALKTNPAIYPSEAGLADIVNRLRAAGRWPATLTPGKESHLPWLSRIARAAGSWGWGIIGIGVAAVVMACRRGSRRFASEG